jgi:hypothetical protein
MKKMFLVLGLVLLASSAFASTTYTFTFDGYCDGMSLTLGKGSEISNVPGPKIFVAGTHGGCVSFLDSGFKHGITTLIPPYKSPVLDVADGESASLSVQYLVYPFSGCVWANYYNPDGVHNYNYLSGTCTLGARPVQGSHARSSSPTIQ